MASQLFYTYEGTTTGVQSNLFSNTSSFTYSLVFDKKRKTVWAQGTEYGIAQVADWDADNKAQQKWKGYNNVEYTLSVNEYGKLVVEGFDPISIKSFNIYNTSNIITTGTVYEVGYTIQSSDEINKFKFELCGSSVDAGTVKTIKLNSSVSINSESGNTYPKISGTNVTPSTATNYAIYTHLNTSSSNNIAKYSNTTHNSSITATLEVTDTKNNTATKTITVAIFRDKVYWFVSDNMSISTDSSITWATIHSKTSFESAWRGNIGSNGSPKVIANTSNSQYYWFMHPSSAGTAECYTPMGKLEWAPGYPITVNLTNEYNYTQSYKIYRSNKPNIGGLKYWITGLSS